MPKVNYNVMKEVVLKDMLTERELPIPINEKGVFIRQDGIDALKKWDAKNNAKVVEATDSDDEDIISKVNRLKKTYYRVIINDVQEDDSPYAFAGINGTAYYIPKNVEVNLGPEIYEVLNKAERVLSKMEVQPDGSVKYFEQKLKRFPMTVLEYPEED